MPSTIKILMAEDDADDARQVKRAFKAEGLSDNLLVFKNGRELIDHIDSAAEQATCILLDMDMPELDGFQVLSHLAKNDRPKIPVFVMSSGRTHREILIKKGIEVSAFLTKPVQFAHFRELCTNLDICIQ